MVRVVANKHKSVRVNVQVSNTGQIISSSPVVVQSLPATPANRLDALVDVDPSGEIEGGVPRYDVETDEYKVEKLAIEDLDPTGNIDGGSF